MKDVIRALIKIKIPFFSSFMTATSYPINKKQIWVWHNFEHLPLGIYCGGETGHWVWNYSQKGIASYSCLLQHLFGTLWPHSFVHLGRSLSGQNSGATISHCNITCYRISLSGDDEFEGILWEALSNCWCSSYFLHYHLPCFHLSNTVKKCNNLELETKIPNLINNWTSKQWGRIPNSHRPLYSLTLQSLLMDFG